MLLRVPILFITMLAATRGWSIRTARTLVGRAASRPAFGTWCKYKLACRTPLEPTTAHPTPKVCRNEYRRLRVLPTALAILTCMSPPHVAFPARKTTPAWLRAAAGTAGIGGIGATAAFTTTHAPASASSSSDAGFCTVKMSASGNALLEQVVSLPIHAMRHLPRQ